MAIYLVPILLIRIIRKKGWQQMYYGNRRSFPVLFKIVQKKNVLLF
jgi:hypothetical protein